MPPPITIDQFFDRKQPNCFSNRVVFICGLLAAIEAMDIYVLGVIIALMAKSFGVTLAMFAIVFTFQAIGQIIGNYFVAPLADTYGRRPVILWCTVTFGILTMISGFSPNLHSFVALRAIAFIFVGGAVPNIFNIASEFAAGHRRPRNSLIIGSFHGIGAGAAALAGGLLLPYGWSVPLIFCGALTLLSAVLAYFYVPESPRFLAADPSRHDALRLLAERMEPDAKDMTFAMETPAPKTHKVRFIELFESQHMRSTILLWVIGGITLSLLGTVAQWLPTYLHNYGKIDLTQAAFITSLSGPAGVVWPLALIVLMRRLGISRSMTLNYSLAAFAFSCFIFLPSSGHVGWILAFGVGAFLGGASSGFYALCGLAYPTHIRATGTSFAVGAGRVCSLFVPLLGGLAISMNVPASVIGVSLAMPLLIAASAAFMLGRNMASRTDNAQVSGG